MAIMTEKEIETAIVKMAEEQREQLKIIISMLVKAYVDDNYRAVVLYETPDNFQICTVNATEYETVNLLGMADEYVNFRVMQTAPEKGMMN